MTVRPFTSQQAAPKATREAAINNIVAAAKARSETIATIDATAQKIFTAFTDSSSQAFQPSKLAAIATSLVSMENTVQSEVRGALKHLAHSVRNGIENTRLASQVETLHALAGKLAMLRVTARASLADDQMTDDEIVQIDGNGFVQPPQTDPVDDADKGVAGAGEPSMDEMIDPPAAAQAAEEPVGVPEPAPSAVPANPDTTVPGAAPAGATTSTPPVAAAPVASTPAVAGTPVTGDPAASPPLPAPQPPVDGENASKAAAPAAPVAADPAPAAPEEEVVPPVEAADEPELPPADGELPIEIDDANEIDQMLSAEILPPDAMGPADGEGDEEEVLSATTAAASSEVRAARLATASTKGGAAPAAAGDQMGALLGAIGDEMLR